MRKTQQSNCKNNFHKKSPKTCTQMLLKFNICMLEVLLSKTQTWDDDLGTQRDHKNSDWHQYIGHIL